MSFDPSLRAPCMTPGMQLFIALEMSAMLKGLLALPESIGVLDVHGNLEGPLSTASVDLLVEALELWLLVHRHEHPTAHPTNPY
jgi:hypothetical protein